MYSAVEDSEVVFLASLLILETVPPSLFPLPNTMQPKQDSPIAMWPFLLATHNHLCYKVGTSFSQGQYWALDRKKDGELVPNAWSHKM